MEEVLSPREGSVFHPGLVLDGRYRLDRPLAEGGMGSIWVGHQIALQREVAVKLLRIGTAPLQQRLRREALALAAVRHPAVVQVFDYGETAGGEPYLVMELVRGEPLGQRVQRGGPFEAKVAVQLVLPLLDGLAAAHEVGIVHRDIKPDNVVLSPGPTGVLPKLIDFGIARVEQTGKVRLTADGGMIGTPAYMAPEQVRGQDVDARADVWGMAVLLYEMMAGQAPFGMEQVISVIRRIVDEPPPYPREARGLDGRLWSVLMDAMRKDPAERIASAPAFRDALAGWLAARGTSSSGTFSIKVPEAGAKAGPLQLVPTLEAPPRPVPAAARSSVQAIRSPPLRVDASADTEPSALSAGPSSFEALIREKFGNS